MVDPIATPSTVWSTTAPVVAIVELIDLYKSTFFQEAKEFVVVHAVFGAIAARCTWHVRLDHNEVDLALDLGSDLIHHVLGTTLAIDQQGVKLQPGCLLDFVEAESGHGHFATPQLSYLRSPTVSRTKHLEWLGTDCTTQHTRMATV